VSDGADRAACGPWSPVEISIDGVLRAGHRLDHEGRSIAYAELGDVVVYVLSRGPRIADLRLERVADPTAYL